MKLLKCPICGNVVEMVEDHGVPLMCCGKKMEEVEAGAVDAALEKHVPVLKVEGDCLTAVVGDVLHPMTPEHLISNIWIEFADGSNKKVTLTSDDEPIAKFNIAGKSGKVESIDLEKETAKVLVDFLGNLTPMEIELVQLEKADL